MAWPAGRPPAAPSADANLETGAPALASLVPVARDGRTCALTSVDLHPVRPPAIRVRVQMARERQTARFKGTRVHCNAEMSSRQLRKYCGLGVDGQALLQRAVDQLGLSARAHDRILKLARTIADLDGQDEIKVPHVAEAIQYRSLDRKLWRG